MAAHEKEMLNQQRLAQGQLGAWQFLATCALWPKAVTASVQRMARRIEDLEAERDNATAERDQLALRLAGWEDGGKRKNGGGSVHRPIDRSRHALRRRGFPVVVSAGVRVG